MGEEVESHPVVLGAISVSVSGTSSGCVWMNNLWYQRSNSNLDWPHARQASDSLNTLSIPMFLLYRETAILFSINFDLDESLPIMNLGSDPDRLRVCMNHGDTTLYWVKTSIPRKQILLASTSLSCFLARNRNKKTNDSCWGLRREGWFHGCGVSVAQDERALGACCGSGCIVVRTLPRECTLRSGEVASFILWLLLF